MFGWKRVSIFTVVMMNHSSLVSALFRRLFLLSVFLFFLTETKVSAQVTGISPADSLLEEQLTRAVQIWQSGKPLPAYQTLDSIMSQPLTETNASSKVKAAIWTATYLEEQKKLKPASRFLDSAMTWASQYSRGDGLKRSYEAYAAWHMANGNGKSAMAAQAQAALIDDSLANLTNQRSLDSLKTIITDLQSKLATQITPAAPEKTVKPAENNDRTIWIMGASIFVLLILVFLLNGKIQRLNSAPPVFVQKEVSRPKPEMPRAETKVSAEIKENVTATVQEKKVQTDKQIIKEEAKAKEVSKDTSALTARLSAVELILIRPEIFAEKVNGESKTASRTLQKYVDEFPAMMKRLDDAIANNDAPAILSSINEFKIPLDTFGMLGTLAWIHEIEAEAPEAKANKLLSRVFQVRNHVRRALDESKAILEKISL